MIMIIYFTDKVDIRTNGKFVPSISCTKKDNANTSVPMILTKNEEELSESIDCKQEIALQRVKTHTTHITHSGTGANIDMTFRVTEKNGNKIVGRCEKLRLNDRCTSSNCHEYGNIENYYVSDQGKWAYSGLWPIESIWDNSYLNRMIFLFLYQMF